MSVCVPVLYPAQLSSGIHAALLMCVCLAVSGLGPLNGLRARHGRRWWWRERKKSPGDGEWERGVNCQGLRWGEREAGRHYP